MVNHKSRHLGALANRDSECHYALRCATASGRDVVSAYSLQNMAVRCLSHCDAVIESNKIVSRIRVRNRTSGTRCSVWIAN